MELTDSEYILRRLGRDESLAVLSGSVGSDSRGRASTTKPARSVDIWEAPMLLLDNLDATK